MKIKGFSSCSITEECRVYQRERPTRKLRRGDKQVIVECDGDEYHLSSGPNGGSPLGRDLIQDRLFARLGYGVVHIRDGAFSKPVAQLTIAQKIDEMLR